DRTARAARSDVVVQLSEEIVHVGIAPVVRFGMSLRKTRRGAPLADVSGRKLCSSGREILPTSPDVVLQLSEEILPLCIVPVLRPRPAFMDFLEISGAR